VKVVEAYKERQAELAEREAGVSCGRTLEIGRDSAGRCYWNFHSDPECLFVSLDPSTQSDRTASCRWHKFEDPESIASVIVGLDKDPMVEDLKKTFPKAHKLIKTGQWSELLLKRRFKIAGRKNESEAKLSKSERTESDLEAEDEEVCTDLHR
jgi:hypothetical protein